MSDGKKELINKKFTTDWADEDDNDKINPPAVPTLSKPTEAEQVDELSKKIDNLDVSERPDLHTGELKVREAGCKIGENITQPVTNFSSLSIDDDLKKSIQEVKGWVTMSKIQQIGLPLILKNPPLNLIGQAQAGTGKTGTFVISMLARIDAKGKPNSPQGIILCVTQELCTQIAEEVNALGKFKGIRARRIMSGFSKPGSQVDGEEQKAAPWLLKRGEDFTEQVVVGTVGKVKQYLGNDQGRRKVKPCIDASDVKILILDEADQMVAAPPYGFGDQIGPIQDMIMKKRKGKETQVLLFSATFTEEVRQVARAFVGGPSVDENKFHEITLRKEDVTLDKVVNFYHYVAHENETNINAMYQAKYDAILEIWRELSSVENMGQTVIFCNEVARVQQCCNALSQENSSVGMIHGKMDKTERDIVLSNFKNNKLTALVSTNLTSRGIDNPNVTLVINVDLPLNQTTRTADPENFVHRIGRSGRWTKKGASVSLIARSPSFNDKQYLNEIEKSLFANAEVDRPLIQIDDLNTISDKLTNELNKIQ